MSHIYVHVPFCVRRCSYCDFSIAVRKRIPAREYVECILREFGDRRVASLETIYFGGGTPSLLPPDAIGDLIRELSPSIRNPQSEIRNRFNPQSAIRNQFNPQSAIHNPQSIQSAIEVTLESNPEDVTPDHARAWKSAGINRVSLGAQSFDDTVLEWMHRSHDAAQTQRAVQILREAGIENISLDLIFGLPEELGRDWERDLEIACALRPPHVSLYGLTVEPRTPLDRWISRGATQVPDEERYAEEYLAAHRRLAGAGYEFYEVSNASLPGMRSRHNSAYWAGKPYIGLGPAAHSFDGTTRRWNLRAWEAYRRAVTEGRSPIESEETLTDEQRRLEALYLGLRTVDGVAVAALCRPLPPFAALSQAGWIYQEGGRIKCTPEGWLRLDSIVNEYDNATH